MAVFLKLHLTRAAETVQTCSFNKTHQTKPLASTSKTKQSQNKTMNPKKDPPISRKHHKKAMFQPKDHLSICPQQKPLTTKRMAEVSRRMAELLEKNPAFTGDVPTPDQAGESSLASENDRSQIEKHTKDPKKS